MHLPNGVRKLGHAATSGGWRGRVADRTAHTIAQRTRLAEDGIRVVIGVVLFALALRFVVKTVNGARHG